MTTAPDIDPRLVCVACGWEVDADGYADSVPGLGLAWRVDDLCRGPAFLAEALDVLGMRFFITLHGHRGRWTASSDALGTDRIFEADTAHEAIYALATSIGRHLEQSS